MSTATSHAAQSLRILRRISGRALCFDAKGALYISRHLRILQSIDDAQSWQEIARLPNPGIRKAAELTRLTTRLLRHEIRALTVLPNGGLVACDRRGVYFGSRGQTELLPSRVEVPAGQSIAPPMTLTTGPNGEVLWGEYKSARGHRQPIHVFASRDAGRSFQVAHVFEGGQIRHVHNIIHDATLGKYWILAGDHEHEPGIGLLDSDFGGFEWVVKGQQRYRAVELFDFGDHIIYGTDTEKEPNAVMRLDKSDGRVERLAELDGSCIYACRFGSIYALSTSIEPSEVNRCREAGLWLSTDGSDWQRVLGARKDRWNETYFQFGSLVLPRGASPNSTIHFSGQAVCDYDGRVITVEPVGFNAG